MAVTPESNLALIEELQELVGAKTYEPVDGPEFSYPAVGQAVDDEMWKYITLALGNGVLDDGGRPYWLRKIGSDSETNSANQMMLTVAEGRGTAQAVLYGFYHRLSENIRLDFPMPLSETTYYVVLELNPLKARAPEGPISVKVYPNELNTESGRQHLILWTVTRKPNQLLTDATINRIRTRAAPAIYVWEEAHKPDADKQLSGSLCVVGETGGIYRVASEATDEDGNLVWVPLSDVSLKTDDDHHQFPGHGARLGSTRIGQMVILEGRVDRPDGRKYLASSTDGYVIRRLPEHHRPAADRRFVTKAVGSNNTAMAVVNVGTDGAVTVYPMEDTSWVSVDGIVYTVRA